MFAAECLKAYKFRVTPACFECFASLRLTAINETCPDIGPVKTISAQRAGSDDVRLRSRGTISAAQPRERMTVSNAKAEAKPTTARHNATTNNEA